MQPWASKVNKVYPGSLSLSQQDVSQIKQWDACSKSGDND